LVCRMNQRWDRPTKMKVYAKNILIFRVRKVGNLKSTSEGGWGGGGGGGEEPGKHLGVRENRRGRNREWFESMRR